MVKRLALLANSSTRFHVEVVYPELRKIEKLIKKDKSCDIVSLSGFVRKKKERAAYIADSVVALFSQSVIDLWGLQVNGSAEWAAILGGLLREFAESSGSQSRRDNTGKITRLDVWRTEHPQASAPIWVSDVELQELMERRGFKDKEQLALGTGWIAADELPRNVILTKLMPRILISLRAPWKKVEGEEFTSAIQLHAWHVGLG